MKGLSASAQDIIDGMAAIKRDDGVIEVFATAPSGQIQRYVQAGTTFEMSDSSVFNFDCAASPPTVARNKDGRNQIFYREATSSGMRAVQVI